VKEQEKKRFDVGESDALDRDRSIDRHASRAADDVVE